MTAPLFGEDEGRRLREEGQEACLAAATHPLRGFRPAAETALAELIAAGLPFDAETIRTRVRDRFGDGVEPHHPNVLPSILGCAVKEGRIRRVEWTRTTRPSRHSSRIGLYVGAQVRAEDAA